MKVTSFVRGSSSFKFGLKGVKCEACFYRWVQTSSDEEAKQTR